MNLKLNYLQHIGIPVSNFENSVVFYQSLGFEVAMESNFNHEGTEGNVAMMKRDKIMLELYQMPEPELSHIKARKDGHIDHIAFDVDDIDETFTLLKNQGFSIIEKSPVFLDFWENGCKYFYIVGPDNERLEFCQIL